MIWEYQWKDKHVGYKVQWGVCASREGAFGAGPY